MATLSVLDFLALSHTHSTRNWILEMTHISYSLLRSEEKNHAKPAKFCEFFINICDFFMRVCDFFINFCGIFSNKKREKLKDCFSPLLIKEEEIWVIQESTLGSQRKRIYSIWPMEL